MIWTSRARFAKSFRLAVILTLLHYASQAHASLVIYSDLSSWSGAISGITTVSVPDPDPDPFTYFGTGNASVAYGGVTFSTDGAISDSSFYDIGSLLSGFSAVLSSQNATNGPANILLTFSAPVNGFALNFGTFNGDDVTFLLSNGNGFTLGSVGGSTYEVPGFAGATDTTPFSSVLITSNDFALNINDISYGISVSAVPEPSTLSLSTVIAVMLFAAWRCRRKRCPDATSRS